MLKQKKGETNLDLSRTLPMPKYEYQKASNGGFTYKYDDKSIEKDDKKKKINLHIQNLKFV